MDLLDMPADRTPPIVQYPDIECIRVLARPNARRAVLFRMVDGQSHYEQISWRNLLVLLESAAEALGHIDPKGKDL